MVYWRRLLVAAVGAASLVGMGAVSASAESNDRLVEFHSMTPITTGLGLPNDRGILGGGKAWMITSGRGFVSEDGHVHVRVKGLVLVGTGTNPIPAFSAEVSCITSDGVQNVMTRSFAATASGSANIQDKVSLPAGCSSPEVFVGAVVSGTFHWFAVSNAEDEGQD